MSNKVWRSKLKYDRQSFEESIAEAIKRAYHDDPIACDPPEEIHEDPCGQVHCDANVHHKQSALMLKAGESIAEGITRLVGDVSDDVARKIQNLVQVGIGAGYMAAIADDSLISKDARTKSHSVREDSKKEKYEEIRDMAVHHPQETQSQIAKRCNVSLSTVKRAMKK